MPAGRAATLVAQLARPTPSWVHLLPWAGSACCRTTPELSCDRDITVFVGCLLGRLAANAKRGLQLEINV